MALAERYYLAAMCLRVGRREAARLLACGFTPAAAFAGLDGSPDDPQHIARLCERHRIDLLTQDDAGYPSLLRTIADPPPVLYAQGRLDALERPAVAVVGARNCTRLGIEIAARLASDLASSGIAVVSGLARGIDTAAHRAALQQGRTVAVLGSGLARPYPSSNRGLVQAILDHDGLLLSEYAPLAPAFKHHFPERNRVISGLSKAVVVVEAGDRSGSLITARMALEQGREVLAVPGPVTSLVSRGCHRLLRDGAALVESVSDVLQALGLGVVPTVPAPGADPMAGRVHNPEHLKLAKVLAAVSGPTTTLDEVVAATGLPSEAAASLLIELELGGFVRQVQGGYIRRPSRSG
jgi:DNA processing protein